MRRRVTLQACGAQADGGADDHQDRVLRQEAGGGEHRHRVGEEGDDEPTGQQAVAGGRRGARDQGEHRGDHQRHGHGAVDHVGELGQGRGVRAFEVRQDDEGPLQHPRSDARHGRVQQRVGAQARDPGPDDDDDGAGEQPVGGEDQDVGR
jgi:hypothetical protein